MERPNHPPLPTGGPVLLAAKLFILGLPFLSFLLIYIVDDPFRVIRHSDFGDFYKDQVWDLNPDYAATEKFFSRYPTARFDSFIFGSSRSMVYYCDQMQSLLPGSRPYHYPAANENLYGNYRKIKMLDELGVALKNVLIVIDGAALSDLSSRTDHLHISHPRVSGEGWFNFQLAFVKAYFTKPFLFYYLDYRIFDQIRPWMKEFFVRGGGAGIRVDPVTNDQYFEKYEQLLRMDEDAFYEERTRLFEAVDSFRRPNWTWDHPLLSVDHQRYLREIDAIFRRHHTNFRIVISPLYDQPELNSQDREILCRIFGRSNVYDFSGVEEITKNRRNYYDPGHYRPFIARMIMRRVFAGNP
jgi:hypothetical protein